MRAALKAIVNLVPPPASPRGLDHPWDAVEREIGLILPDDYKAFIDLYGSGRIVGEDGWLDIRNFRERLLFEFPLHQLLCGDQSEIARYKREMESGYPCPYPLYPAGGGLLPFARVLDVNNLNWLTKGRPSRWDVVYWSFDDSEFAHYAGESFSRCLLKVLNGEHAEITSLAAPFEFKDDSW